MIRLCFALALSPWLAPGSTQSATPSPGFTYADPMPDSSAMLIDENEQVVNSWSFNTRPGLQSEFAADGTLLRTYIFGVDGLGSGGGLQRIGFDGTVLWDVTPSVPGYLHHDIAELPNGNVLMTATDPYTSAEMIALGMDPANAPMPGELLSEIIIEVQQTGPTTGAIVWQWRAIDHLVQDFDATKPNFDVVSNRPERADVNWQTDIGSPLWLHTNSIDYNPDLDQIVISNRTWSEFWVIDHSTTTAEAAGSTGGNSGKGGDILYRWGNPATYKTAGTRHLFGQHDVSWIDAGLSGEGNLMCFNNQKGQLLGGILASSVTELIPPVDMNGNYALTPGQPYGPAAPIWEYLAPNPTDMYSPIVSGAQRLPNGNTLITVGIQNRILEVGLNDQVVWEASVLQCFKARRIEGSLIGAPETYCAAKASSASCVAQISASSVLPAISGANDFSILASGTQGLKNGLLFGGLSGATATPFLGGTLCVQPPLKRGVISSSGGTSSISCDGSFSVVVNDGVPFPSAFDGQPGNTAWYQFWYRDPMSPGGAALSDGLSVKFH